MITDKNDSDKDGSHNLLDNDSSVKFFDKEKIINDSFDKEKTSKIKNDKLTVQDNNKTVSKNNYDDSGVYNRKNDKPDNNTEEGAVRHNTCPTIGSKRQFNGNETSHSRPFDLEKCEDRINSKMVQLGHMMSSTLSMHSKMQESMQLWLDRCNHENMVTRPKIVNETIMPKNFKLMTVQPKSFKLRSKST